ncbi:prepilin-type N-terminal cleavage/methylation domain-containing protein [Porticoccus sp. W117]|uniref:type II secretion system protein n=1 Tax=Porticoccus sp. W117 TaxID=3054777 RepID=UPI0025982B64|nr:prepilin-type N-terminal cleavage/methylation domain-containing protein [Porticoccus sp. W117]MDM3871427.1 prepilin-type N-terminal cleavage/methylation domain-containing protein [Porticoccus sp. W117]
MNSKNSVFRSASNNGFTLIELILVVVIIGILATVAASRYVDLREAVLQTHVKTVMSSLQTGHQMARIQWILAGSPGAGSPGTLHDIDVDGITVRFRNGQPHTIRGNLVPAGTPARNAASTRLFFLYLSVRPGDIVARSDSDGTGWVMDRNANCANVAPQNRRRCWLYQDGGEDFARITYSVNSGQFSTEFL